MFLIFISLLHDVIFQYQVELPMRMARSKKFIIEGNCRALEGCQKGRSQVSNES